MIRLTALLPLLLLLALPVRARAAELPMQTLAVGTQKMTVEVAASPGTRETGLMHRFSLKPDHGMLFVFSTPQPLAFWMHDTYVPLSIAFVDADGRILNIEDMRPMDDGPRYYSKGAALYAIEMTQGWYAKKGIVAGAQVKGLPAPSRD
jgi:uncharacterized membrane protein (UPF0127 family)